MDGASISNAGMRRWDVAQVCEWLKTLQLGQYSSCFQYHRVSGDILPELDMEDLQEMGVASLGHRIRILNAISPTVRTRHLTIAERLERAEQKVDRLNDAISRLRADLLPLFRRAKELEPLPTPAPSSLFNSAGSSASLHSGTLTVTGPLGQPSTPTMPTGDHKDLPRPLPRSSSSLGRNHPSAQLSRTSSGDPSPTLVNLSLAESFKSFRVSTDDPCTKILPVVLRKYKIYEDPADYRLLVAYDNQHRELADHEKPLHLYKELQDAGKRPVFMVQRVSRSLRPHTPGGVI